MNLEKCSLFFGDALIRLDEIPDKTKEVSVYQGRLGDCEAYIRLHEGGYM